MPAVWFSLEPSAPRFFRMFDVSLAATAPRLRGLRLRDVLHAWSEQHHADVVRPDVRLPAYAASHGWCDARLRFHDRLGGRWPWNGFHRVPGAREPAEIRGRGLLGLSRLDHR